MLSLLLLAAMPGIPGGEPAPAGDRPLALCHPGEEITFDAATGDGKRVSVCSTRTGGDERRIVLRYGGPAGLLCERTNDRSDGGSLVVRRYTRPRVTYLSVEASCETFDLEVSEAYEAEGKPIWLTVLFVRDRASEDPGHGEPLSPTTAPLALIAIEPDVIRLPFDG